MVELQQQARGETVGGLWLNMPRHIARAFRSVFWRIVVHGDMLVAAGVAFYGFLAVFPALAILISIYGLIFDLAGIDEHAGLLADILPNEARPIVLDALVALTNKGPAKLNTGLLIALAVGIWSARAGVAALMEGVNIAFEVRDDRNTFITIGISLALTLGAILFAVLTLTTIAAVPAALAIVHVRDVQQATVLLVRWPILAALAFLSISIIYYVVPRAGHGGSSARLIPGAIVATILWLIGSSLFSYYVESFARYDATYGSLGGVVVLMLWLWFTALVVLVGAEVNAYLHKLSQPKPIDAF